MKKFSIFILCAYFLRLANEHKCPKLEFHSKPVKNISDFNLKIEYFESTKVHRVSAIDLQFLFCTNFFQKTNKNSVIINRKSAFNHSAFICSIRHLATRKIECHINECVYIFFQVSGKLYDGVGILYK